MSRLMFWANGLIYSGTSSTLAWDWRRAIYRAGCASSAEPAYSSLAHGLIYFKERKTVHATAWTNYRPVLLSFKITLPPDLVNQYLNIKEGQSHQQTDTKARTQFQRFKGK